MLEKTRIEFQEVRSAQGADWHAVMVMVELLKRQDRTQTHPALDGAHVFVATADDDRIVGMIAAHEPKDGICTVSNLYVLQAHRHRGIGTALLQAALAYAGPKAEVRLAVNRANKQARRIYRRLGFRLSAHVDLRLAP
jgi:ribosomal protein S18 acetylase RimI-like enzyme